jgi:anti-anti-sigma factor
MNNEIVSPDATTAALQPAGDLVVAMLPALRSTMRDMVESGTLHLTVDLTAVHAVDSAGIGLLISAHNSLKKAGGELTVIHASADILELFRTMRIHRHLSVSGN